MKFSKPSHRKTGTLVSLTNSRSSRFGFSRPSAIATVLLKAKPFPRSSTLLSSMLFFSFKTKIMKIELKFKT